MAELGTEAPALHAAVGNDVKKAGVRNLVATGDLCRHAVAAFGDGAQWFSTHEELIEKLHESLSGDCSVLVKGSRSMGMERVVNALRRQPDQIRSA
jgi:UDP-N-acetylmuramoyl-tripeptide--D-alanyl-D-alanine ligase